MKFLFWLILASGGGYQWFLVFRELLFVQTTVYTLLTQNKIDRTVELKIIRLKALIDGVIEEEVRCCSH